MRRGFVYLLALALPMLLAAETFKVTLDREARVGGTVLKPGDYKVTVESGKSCIIAAGHSWDAAPTLAQGTGI